MRLEELTDRLETGTTRRTIVKTGVKFAYAAPLVAASFKLHGAGAQTRVSPGGNDPTCIGANCGTFRTCGAGGECVCFTTSAGTGFCATGSNPCSELTPCPNGQLDCPANTVCIVDTCCVFGGHPAVCQPIIFACTDILEGAAGAAEAGVLTPAG